MNRQPVDRAPLQGHCRWSEPMAGAVAEQCYMHCMQWQRLRMQDLRSVPPVYIDNVHIGLEGAAAADGLLQLGVL